MARAAVAGLPTLPGVVLTTGFTDEIDTGADVAEHPATREAFARTGGEQRDLVARSSSVVEDLRESSMAGQFDSIIGIRGFDAFVVAVKVVLESRERAGAADQPIAVLVQPFLDAEVGGVLFGIDPVSGRSDRRVVTAVEGGPEPLVSGEVDGSHYVLDPRARVLELQANDGPALQRADLERLVALSDDVATVFGGPQDVEWAIATDTGVTAHVTVVTVVAATADTADTVGIIDADTEPTNHTGRIDPTHSTDHRDRGQGCRKLWLLQSRPVTSEVRGVPRGPVYGPGPVAETFPEPLTELERDLWVPPLREAVREAVLLAGSATPAEVEASEIVVCIDGHVAIDLELAGEIRPKPTLGQRLNPVVGLRRLRNAWRVGRLRAALPRLAEDLLDRTDADLQAVPALSELTSRQLFALLHRSQAILRSLHAHEILMGLLTDTGGNRMTGASVALRVLAEARQDGLSDAEILETSPVVLALTPPRIAPGSALPPEAAGMYLGADGDSGSGTDFGIDREALRLRIRWLQELSGRAAWELGERLTARGQLTEPELIRHMSLEHLEAVATKRAVVVPSLVATHKHEFGAPLPAWFQLSDLGKPIRAQCEAEIGGGTGAGGGVASGPVTYDTDDPPAGSVLVTTTLSPGLGIFLPRLNGIVSETGSVLSHLAILSREAGVPTVVGYANATRDLPEGAMALVDGTTGRVTVSRTSTADETSRASRRGSENLPGPTRGPWPAGRGPRRAW